MPHAVKEGESFEHPHPDVQKNLQLKKSNQNHGVNDGVVGRIACCCNAAPCCFPGKFNDLCANMLCHEHFLILLLFLFFRKTVAALVSLICKFRGANMMFCHKNLLTSNVLINPLLLCTII